MLKVERSAAAVLYDSENDCLLRKNFTTRVWFSRLGHRYNLIKGTSSADSERVCREGGGGPGWAYPLSVMLC